MPVLPGIGKNQNKTVKELLEGKSQFVDDNEVILNARRCCAFVVITGEEITESEHIRQVIGDFVSSFEVNFPAVGTRN